jgi:hypothetical protein
LPDVLLDASEFTIPGAFFAVNMGIFFRGRDCVFRSIGVDITVLTYTRQRYLAQLPHSEAKLDLVMESIAQGLPSRDVYLRIQGKLTARCWYFFADAGNETGNED